RARYSANALAAAVSAALGATSPSRISLRKAFVISTMAISVLGRSGSVAISTSTDRARSHREVRQQLDIPKTPRLGEMDFVGGDECRPLLQGHGVIERIEEVTVEVDTHDPAERRPSAVDVCLVRAIAQDPFHSHAGIHDELHHRSSSRASKLCAEAASASCRRAISLSMRRWTAAALSSGRKALSNAATMSPGISSLISPIWAPPVAQDILLGHCRCDK